MFEGVDIQAVAFYIAIFGFIIFLIIKWRSERMGKLDNEQKKYIKADAGKQDLDQANKTYFLSLLKFGYKEKGLFNKRKLYLGFIKLGYVSKIIEIQDKRKILLIKNSFWQFTDKQKDIFMIDNQEVTNKDSKGIYINNDNLINIYGVFVTVSNLKDKNDFIKSIVDKNIIEDWHGRIKNTAGSVIYYNMRHAQDSDIMQKKIEAERELDIKAKKIL